MKNNNRKKNNLKIVALGGLKEIGKNMTAYEYKNEIIIVDTGSIFPEDELLGVDIVIPDTSYLERNESKVKAIIYTHGHEDHIGASPYIIQKFNVPIYATPFTLALIKRKFKEHKIKNIKMHEKNAGDKFKIGNFSIEMINVNHSIPDAVALFIKTPAANVLQTGDFKIDFNPVNEPIIDLTRLGAIGSEGVDLLLSDSTNVGRKGYTMSESSVGSTFDELFSRATGRIIVASFASNVFRVQQVCNSARLHNRKVAFTGRSMNNVTKIAMDMKYLNFPKDDIIDISQVNKYPDNEVVIMSTGSQGEPMAALTRMADKNHNQVEMKPGDMVIFSSSPIPGNEKNVNKVINKLTEIGVDLIYDELADVHVSGHACQEELKLILALVKPKFFMPVHGEYRMLSKHAEIAISMGIAPSNVIVSQNGQLLEVSKESFKKLNMVESGRILIDGAIAEDVGNAVLRDRKLLSEDGLVMILLRVDEETGEIVKEPDVISRGFVYIKESGDLLDEAKQVIEKTYNDLNPAQKSDWAHVKNLTRRTINKFLYSKTKRSPMILVFILEV